jgi:hypothetical protein
MYCDFIQTENCCEKDFHISEKYNFRHARTFRRAGLAFDGVNIGKFREGFPQNSQKPQNTQNY